MGETVFHDEVEANRALVAETRHAIYFGDLGNSVPADHLQQNVPTLTHVEGSGAYVLTSAQDLEAYFDTLT